MLLVLQSIKSA